MVNVLIDNSTYLQNSIKDWEQNQIQSLKRQLSKELSAEKKKLQESYDEFEEASRTKNESQKQQLIQKYTSLAYMKKKSFELEEFARLYDAVTSELILTLENKSKKTDAFFSRLVKQLVSEHGKGKLFVPKHVSVTGTKSELDSLAVQLHVDNQVYELTVAEVIEQSQSKIGDVLRE